MRLGRLFATVMVAIALTAGSAFGNTIDFGGNNGGTISYAGGLTPLVAADLPISSVFGTPPGSGSSISVVGGQLSFSTGNFSGGMVVGPSQFINIYNNGGSILITGAVPTAAITTDTTLLQGTFSGMPVFQYSGSGLASLNGGLSLTYLHSALSDYFQFGPLAGTEPGVIAQADFGITFDGPPIFGVGFSGSQSSVNIALNVRPVSVPEASSLMMVLSGLSVLGVVRLGFARRRRLHSSA